MTNTPSKDHQPIGYANFFQRVNAFFIDCVAFLPLSYIDQYNMITFKSLFVLFAIPICWWIYKPFMEWRFGATLGKMALGIRVVDAQMNKPSFNQCMLRFTPYFAVSLSVLMINYGCFTLENFQEIVTVEALQEAQTQMPSTSLLISALFFISMVSRVLFDPNRQGTHDKLSATYCILVQRVPKEVQ